MIAEWLGGFFLSNVREITACIMAWLTTSEHTGCTEQYLSFLSNGCKNPRINFLTVMDSSIALFFYKEKDGSLGLCLDQFIVTYRYLDSRET